MSERVIFKVGGSLLSPYEEAYKKLATGEVPFDFEYAKELATVLKESGRKFVIVIGGGFLNRWVLKGVRDAGYSNDETRRSEHFIGMAASDIAANVFHMVCVNELGTSKVFPHVVKYTEYDQLSELKSELDQYDIIIAAGWKPGHSHDVDALMFAGLFGTNQVVSLKNIDGIYSADPKRDSTAVKKRVLTWYEYRSIIHETEHQPGASYPIDAIAAQLAEKMKIGFTVIDGRDFEAVKEVITTRLSSRGSVVSPGN